MNYPSPHAYSEALQLGSLAILDPHLRTGRVETDSFDLPFGRTGSFAITFKIAYGGAYYAFRCFLQNRSTIHERYDAISEHLQNNSLPYFVDFTYLDEGIRVNDSTYPTVRMSWAQGTPLGLYVQDHHRDVTRMRALHQQIQDMAQALSDSNLAHGDIQGGNILVNPTGEVTLVDYDGMYVPSIANLGAIETGHPNFQHPARADRKPFDSNVDRFSLALLHTVLSALIEDPSLWERLNADPDRILIGADDLAAPFSSPAFAALTVLPTSGTYAKSLQAIASAPYDTIPAFQDFVNHRNIPAAQPATGTTRPRSGGVGGGGPVPWYTEYAEAGEVNAKMPGSLGTYTPTTPVMDASNAGQWAEDRPWNVELIGQIARVDVGQSGRELPYARLVLCDGDPELTVDIWAEGMRRFAEQGITVDKSWSSQWVSVVGSIQGPIGSPKGQRYSLTVTQPKSLERINAQQARWRLASATSTGTAAANSSGAKRNADALGGLSGEPQKPTASQRPATASSPPASSVPSKQGGLSAAKTFWIIVAGIASVILLTFIVLLATGGIVLSSSSASRDDQGAGGDLAGTESNEVLYETCFQGEGERVCSEGRIWMYYSCWQGDASDFASLELQRKNINDAWVRAQNIVAVKNDCEPGFPWTIKFERDLRRVGTFDYRIFNTFFGDSLEFIQVSVQEK